MYKVLQHKPATSPVFTGREHQPALTAPTYLALLKKIITELTWQPGCAQITWLEHSRAHGPSAQAPAVCLLPPCCSPEVMMMASCCFLQLLSRASEDFVHFWERVNKGRLSAPPQETGGQCRGASRGVGAAASVIFTDEGVDDLKQVLLVSLLAR